MTDAPASRFEPRIRLADVLMLATLLGSVGGSWASIKIDLAGQAQRLATLEARFTRADVDHDTVIDLVADMREVQQRLAHRSAQ